MRPPLLLYHSIYRPAWCGKRTLQHGHDYGQSIAGCVYRAAPYYLHYLPQKRGYRAMLIVYTRFAIGPLHRRMLPPGNATARPHQAISAYASTATILSEFCYVRSLGRDNASGHRTNQCHTYLKRRCQASFVSVCLSCVWFLVARNSSTAGGRVEGSD